MNAEQNGNLFTVHVRPVVAATVLAVGIVLLLVSAEGLFIHVLVPADLHIVVRVVLWILFVVAVITTIVGVKQMVRPVRIFEVTERGVVQYMRAGIALEAGQLLPWERIESMELTEKPAITGAARASSSSPCGCAWTTSGPKNASTTSTKRSTAFTWTRFPAIPRASRCSRNWSRRNPVSAPFDIPPGHRMLAPVRLTSTNRENLHDRR